MEKFNNDSNGPGKQKDTQPLLSDFFKDSNVSAASPKENRRVLILDCIRKNSPMAFPRLVEAVKLKRTTVHDAVRDLEFSRLVTTYFVINETGQSVKWVKLREGVEKK